jgi:hypothetical protein
MAARGPLVYFITAKRIVAAATSRDGAANEIAVRKEAFLFNGELRPPLADDQVERKLDVTNSHLFSTTEGGNR